MPKAEKIDFEKSLEELNKIVETMEQGDQSLEKSLTQFERGVALIKTCQTALQDAELKVQKLTQENGKEKLEDFE